MDARPPRPEEIWDSFIDALDRAGQAGGAQGVIVPAIAVGPLAGRRFGDLSRKDAEHLARIAGAFGRRGETVMGLWQDTQRRLKGESSERPRPKRGR
jgi:hypothetical protein